MSARFKKDTLDKINESYRSGYGKSLGLHLHDSLGNTSICINILAVCKVTELSQLINELTALRETIAEETGITF